MKALEETRPAAKDQMLPLITLQRWVGSHSFDATVAKVDAAFGGRAVIVDLTDDIFASGSRRPVHDTLDFLRDGSSGYRNWYDFVESQAHFIPALQTRIPAEIAAQVPRALSLGRGIVVRLTENMFPVAGAIASLLKVFTHPHDVLFVLDLERQSRDLLSKALMIHPVVQAIRAELPECIITTCASTFPESFTAIDRQDIYERQFFEVMRPVIGTDRTVYSDRASVRVDRNAGGGGAPAPRVDNALRSRWRFYREADEGDRDAGYQRAATAALACTDWTDLGIWGTNQIKLTASGGTGGINYAGASTAVRINIHMHVQAVGAAAAAIETEWTD